MSEIIFEVEGAPEGGYTARALAYSIFTEADTFDELREMARDAVRTHFDEDDPEARARSGSACPSAAAARLPTLTPVGVQKRLSRSVLIRGIPR